jgi:hypothetical protein
VCTTRPLCEAKASTTYSTANPEVRALVDSGSRGLAKDHPSQVIAPPLKPKKSASTDETAAHEAARESQSSARIPAERAVAELEWWRQL